MSTYTTPHVRRVTTERLILAAIALAAVLATVSGARITWPTPVTSAPAPQSAATTPETDHATRVAAAAAEARGLRELVQTVPATAPALADRIQLLDLVTAGTLPVAAAEPSVPVPTTSVALQQRDPVGTRVRISARQDLGGLREVLRMSPGLAPALAEEVVTLEAIAGGDVPSQTRLPSTTRADAASSARWNAAAAQDEAMRTARANTAATARLDAQARAVR